jgi:hypothetical protein
MSKTARLSLIFTLVVVALIIWSMMGVKQVTCEVCITFNNRTECRTGQGRTREDAIQTAQTAACAVLTSGMDEVVRCGQVQPASVSCDD